METQQRTKITIDATVNAPVEKVWKHWNDPAEIQKWAFATDDWHAPHSENDLRVDGKFKTTMAAKDGSVSFDFTGVYTNVQPNKLIEYVMDDGRKVSIAFTDKGDSTHVSETFEAEDENPIDMQRDGWQSILNNFKNHVEQA